MTLSSAFAATPAGFPFADEDLNYSINWPTGLSLGEAHMHAKHAGAQWEFDLTLDATIPGFPIADRYSSLATSDLCSLQFDRVSTHGYRKSDERTTIDRSAGTATRTTKGGGKSDIPVSDCVRDALTFLYYTRRELGQGRVPPAQTVLFGPAYQARLEYTGAQTIRVGEVPSEADHVVCTFHGTSSNFTAGNVFRARCRAHAAGDSRRSSPSARFRWSWCAEGRVFLADAACAQRHRRLLAKLWHRELEQAGATSRFSTAPEKPFDPARFDIALYQIGNNRYHDFVYETALRHPGVVVMHESNLHHLIADLTILRGDWDAYVAEANTTAARRRWNSRGTGAQLESGPITKACP